MLGKKINQQHETNFFINTGNRDGDIIFFLQKCIECKAEGGPNGANSLKQEYCGNKSQRETAETNWTTTSKAAGYTTYKCD